MISICKWRKIYFYGSSDILKSVVLSFKNTLFFTGVLDSQQNRVENARSSLTHITSSTINILYHTGTFIMINEHTLICHYHLKSIVTLGFTVGVAHTVGSLLVLYVLLV